MSVDSMGLCRPEVTFNLMSPLGKDKKAPAHKKLCLGNICNITAHEEICDKKGNIIVLRDEEQPQHTD